MTDRSRAMRLGQQIAGISPDMVEARFSSARILLRLSPEGTNPGDAAILSLLCDQLSRFCGVVLIGAGAALEAECVGRDLELHPEEPRVAPAHATADQPDLTLTVGARCSRPAADEIIVTSDAWVGRICSTTAGPGRLGANLARNPVGELAAACLGAGETFLRLLDPARPRIDVELSIWSGEHGHVGSLPLGPELPPILPRLDALLVGCGNVANGLAAALRPLQMRGQLRLVDREALGEENLGPYLVASRAQIGAPKTEVIEGALAGTLDVMRHDEDVRFFLQRITRYQQFALPSMTINGLDNIAARHAVQHLWPAWLLDMAAGGTTAQVHLYRRGEDGQCLFGAFSNDTNSDDFEEHVTRLTGLSPTRVSDDYARRIDRGDVAAAPPHHRADLEKARQAGVQICGYISSRILGERNQSDDFAGAAPFLGGITGARAVAIVIKNIIGVPDDGGLHWQYDFTSARARNLVLRCDPACICQSATVPRE